MTVTFVEYDDDEAYFDAHGTARPDPHFVDFNALQDSRWDTFAKDRGITPLSEMTGQHELGYLERTHMINPRTGERVRIDPKPPWTPEMENWQSPDVGLDYIRAMRAASSDWWCDPSHFAAVEETLETFEIGLLAASERKARFRLC